MSVLHIRDPITNEFVPIAALQGELYDGSVTEEKLADASITPSKFHQSAVQYIDNEIASFADFCKLELMPVYLGDFLIASNEQAGCCMRVGNKVYCFVSNTSASTNIGRGIIYDLTNNSLDREVSIPVGHANSCAYDAENEAIYIAPVWNYDLGPSSIAHYLYKYDLSLQYLGKEMVPFVPCGVSYDPINKMLYGKSSNGSKEIYRKEDGQWKLFTYVDYPLYEDNNKRRTYDQDIAVYDNKVYFPSSNRSILFGIIKGDSIEIRGAVACSDADSTNTFYLGELEGAEFDANGHLLASNYRNLDDRCKNAFVTEIPVGTAPVQIPNMGDSTWETPSRTTLNKESQDSFSLGRYHIRSLLQIFSLVKVPPMVMIDGTTPVEDLYNIRLYQDLTLLVKGTYTIQAISIYQGRLTVVATEDNATIVSTLTYIFNPNRGGDLIFPAGNVLKLTAGSGSGGKAVVSTTGRYTDIAAFPVMSDGSPFKINNTNITAIGLYRNGVQKIAY